jgi:NitT/TauT family transport system substrate-binding protein
MKKLLTSILLLASASAFAETAVKIAVQPTFAAHQQIGYEIINRLPDIAAKHGIADLKIETVKTKSSIEGNSFLLNGQVDINVGSVSSFLILNSKDPGGAKLLSAIGHYKYFLLCKPEIKTLDDVRNTNIALSSRNTAEAHTLMWLANANLGDTNAFEKNIVVMPRPQIYQILKAGSDDVKCAMTGAPMQNQLIEDIDLHIVAESDVSKGYPGSYNAYWTTSKWISENPTLALAYVEAANSVIADYNSNPLPILNRFIEKDKLSHDPAKLAANENVNKASWHTDPKGLEFLINFYYDEINYLKENRPTDIASLVYSSVDKSDTSVAKTEEKPRYVWDMIKSVFQ